MKKFFLAIVLLMPFGAAHAQCNCPEPPAPTLALRQSTTAFIGAAERIMKSPIKTGYNEVKFTLMKRLKGFDEIKTPAVTVYTPETPENCGFVFSEGQDYVVFAQGNPAGLRTTACMGTNYLDNMSKDIDALVKGAEPEAAAQQ